MTLVLPRRLPAAAPIKVSRRKRVALGVSVSAAVLIPAFGITHHIVLSYKHETATVVSMPAPATVVSTEKARDLDAGENIPSVISLVRFSVDGKSITANVPVDATARPGSTESIYYGDGGRIRVQEPIGLAGGYSAAGFISLMLISILLIEIQVTRRARSEAANRKLDAKRLLTDAAALTTLWESATVQDLLSNRTGSLQEVLAREHHAKMCARASLIEHDLGVGRLYSQTLTALNAAIAEHMTALTELQCSAVNSLDQQPAVPDPTAGSLTAVPVVEHVPDAALASTLLDELLLVYGMHETSAHEVLRRPALADATVTATAQFLAALSEAQTAKALWQGDASVERARTLEASVRAACIAYRAADAYATRVGLGLLSASEATAVKRAAALLRTAVDEAATPAERATCYEKVKKLLDGIIDLPMGARNVLEASLRLALV